MTKVTDHNIYFWIINNTQFQCREFLSAFFHYFKWSTWVNISGLCDIISSVPHYFCHPRSLRIERGITLWVLWHFPTAPAFLASSVVLSTNGGWFGSPLRCWILYQHALRVERPPWLSGRELCISIYPCHPYPRMRITVWSSHHQPLSLLLHVFDWNHLSINSNRKPYAKWGFCDRIQDSKEFFYPFHVLCVAWTDRLICRC